jgi:hypothetical protein
LGIALGYTGRTEELVLQESPEALEAITVIEEEGKVKVEAKCPRLGLTMFTERSRTDNSTLNTPLPGRTGSDGRR